jgi:hypothetical protein
LGPGCKLECLPGVIVLFSQVQGDQIGRFFAN